MFFLPFHWAKCFLGVAKASLVKVSSIFYCFKKQKSRRINCNLPEILLVGFFKATQNLKGSQKNNTYAPFLQEIKIFLQYSKFLRFSKIWYWKLLRGFLGIKIF